MNTKQLKYLKHFLHVPIADKRDPYYDSFYDLLVQLFKALFTGKIYFPISNKNKHLFYFGTKNQFNALSKINAELANTSTMYYHGHDVIFEKKPSAKFPFWIAYIIALLYYPFAFEFNYIFKKKKYRASSFTADIAYSKGLYIVCNYILTRVNPRYIWLSNDHSPVNVAFIHAAKEQKVESIYVQHASVSKLFPGLVFDYAFLDGEIAYNIYKDIGVFGTKTYLSGISKMDGWINKYENKEVIKNILICLNTLDDLVIYDNLIVQLHEKGFLIKIRKHPFLKDILKCENVSKLCTAPTLLASLENIDIVIGGDSNIHLEATLCNVPSIYFSTNQNYDDYYGFVKNNLVVGAFRNKIEVLKYLETYPPQTDIYLRAKAFCASVGEDYMNKSTEYIINKIKL